MKRHSIFWTTTLLALLYFSAGNAAAQNFRRISHAEGLTNSSVLDLCQDSDGIVWIGACDGFSAYYGQQVHPVVFENDKDLKGQLIEQLLLTKDEDIWARTDYGLSRARKAEGILHEYPQFPGAYQIALSGRNDIVVLDNSNEFYFYDSETDRFVPMEIKQRSVKEPIGFGCTEHYFWIAGEEGIYRYAWTPTPSNEKIVLENSELLTREPMQYCILSDEGEPFLTDTGGNLLHLDVNAGRLALTVNIGAEMFERGKVTGIVERAGSMLISFLSKGILRYTRGEDGEWSYDDLGLGVGVFHIRKDVAQNLIWIATDGIGIIQYWNSEYQVKETFGQDAAPYLGHPVRAFFRDRDGSLWVGSKGGGMLHVGKEGEPSRLYTQANSPLKDNSIFAFAPMGDGFWIGGEKGLNYYDRNARRLLAVQTPEEVSLIHSLVACGDSVLWAATVGNGIFRLDVRMSASGPSVAGVRQLCLDGGRASSNYFFCIREDSNGRILAGNRGLGLYVVKGDRLEKIPIQTARTIPTVNGVFSLLETGDDLWIGTGNGLVCMRGNGEELYFSDRDGLPDNTIHELMEDDAGSIWISTNNGLARLDRETLRIEERYGHEKGLSITEFSDGAVLKEAHSILFGGVFGWVEVTQNPAYVPQTGFQPKVLFTTLSSGEEMENLYLLMNRNQGKIDLDERTNILTIEFFVNDNINNSEYVYSYRMQNPGSDKEDVWNLLGETNVMTISNLDYGDNRVQIQAMNRRTGDVIVSDPLSFHIPIPWYKSTAFRTSLVLLVLLLLLLSMLLFNTWREKKRQDTLFEERLMLFTNITHEFKTPLSMIYVPCEEISEYEGSDAYINERVDKIRSNAERLNSLIQEIIDYRRLETGHQNIRPVLTDVSTLCADSVNSFGDIAHRYDITLEKDIPENINWTLDKKGFNRIAFNLISNAVKYTRPGGMIRVSLKVSDDGQDLVLKVYNTGAGISEKDIKRLFNRYHVLDNVEETGKSEITSRNGLGLAICKSTAELMGGTIGVRSEVGHFAEFTVTFPLIPAQEIVEENKETAAPAAASDTQRRPSVLVVDDNSTLGKMLQSSLTEYDVHFVTKADEALASVRNTPPDLIVTDIMMSGMDGIRLTSVLKGDKHTMHIPVIILSAKDSTEDRIQGFRAGADAYLCKPFSINELKAVINRLLFNTETLQEYYNTSASAFRYKEGKLISTGDDKFLSEVTAYLEEHLSDPALSVEDLAASVNLSTRNLYRKFKSLDLLPPAEFIRQYRLQYAAKLLRTTDETVSEILYSCGFNNQAGFYREFKNMFGETPKAYRQSHQG